MSNCKLKKKITFEKESRLFLQVLRVTGFFLVFLLTTHFSSSYLSNYFSLISMHLLSCYFFSICLQPNTFKFHFIPHLFPLTFFYFHPLYFFPLYQTDPRRNNEAGKFIPTYYTLFCILGILN